MSRLLTIARSPYFIGAAAIFFASCMNAMIKGLSVYESVVVITAWRYTLGATLVILLWFIFRPPLPGWSAVPFHVFRGFFQISAASLFLVCHPNTTGNGSGTWTHRDTNDWAPGVAAHARAA